MCEWVGTGVGVERAAVCIEMGLTRVDPSTVDKSEFWAVR